MPDEIGLLAQANARRLARGVRRVEETKLDAGGILGEDREVDARAGKAVPAILSLEVRSSLGEGLAFGSPARMRLQQDG